MSRFTHRCRDFVEQWVPRTVDRPFAQMNATDALERLIRVTRAETLDEAADYVETQHAPAVPYNPGQGFASLVAALHAQARTEREAVG